MDSSSSYQSDEGPAQKVSVSMPAGRIAAVKARVGARGFSAYISAAVERQIQRDLLEELLQANEAETGPIPQEMHDRAAQAFRSAEALAAQEHADEAGQGEDAWHGREAS
ncbi:hypothetical protein NLX86_13385 [Streptomyces sp. A3M-1-3]|uniref:hypothetical protein n=1 Tax=Streptomyces sp. A3M-1-3 TaxID=2962044 RepID=UPI0020B7304C|nr:hypothetical protein [Streptomyces sp. A3M-1-3]MCP3819071.1 hypothetical protein [Streptomyces sp. A3M-1-3]